MVVVTRSGYIKRMPLDHGDFSEPTLRGTRGKAGASKTTKKAATSMSTSASTESAKSAEAAAKEDAASASEVTKMDGQRAVYGKVCVELSCTCLRFCSALLLDMLHSLLLLRHPLHVI